MDYKAAALSVIGAMMPISALARNDDFDEHYQLYQAIRAVGVRVELNAKECGEGMDGFYQSSRRRLVVCQDRGRPNGPEVDWSENDKDTLRHEAQHLVQDCNGAGNGNNHLVPLMPLRWSEQVLGRHQARALMNNPAYRGKPHVHHIETEAFAVAAHIPASVIAEKVLQCQL